MQPDQQTPCLLDVEGLTISLRQQPQRQLVKGISFAMGTECVALVGESGSGKSLTARALMGLLSPSCQLQAQRLSFAGQDVLSLGEKQWRSLRGRQIAMVLQDPKYALNPGLRIGTQLEEPLLLHTRLSPRERRDKVLHMLDAVGLPDPARLQHALPHQLSGGMGQRVMLAIALITEPALLIADEPTSALDAALREQMLALMLRLVAEQGSGLLLISHDLPLVAQHCQRALVMYQGRLVDQLAAADLPQATHPYTRTLWACRPGKHSHGTVLPVFDRQWLETLA